MDILGHLNQSVYHELLEEGRAALITENVRRVGGDPLHWAFVLAHVDLDYHGEVRKDHGEVTVVVRVAEVGRTITRELQRNSAPNNLSAAGGAVSGGEALVYCANAAHQQARQRAVGHRTRDPLKVADHPVADRCPEVL